MNSTTHLDLCSGIGGFALGFNHAGFETVGFAEIDPYCSQLLESHWPGVPNFGDVSELLSKDLPHADIITAGYPCQPFSFAGQRKGSEDDRHLWPYLREIITQRRPTWAVFENVYGHISLGLDEVLSDLENEKYATRPFVVPACGVDAPHRRNRVWIIARNVGRSRCGGLQRDDGGRTRAEPTDRRETMADTSGQRPQRCGETRILRQYDIQTPPERSGKTFPELWPTEPSVGRVAHGVPNRVDRIKGLGNAIVPQVATAIARTITQVETMDT